MGHLHLGGLRKRRRFVVGTGLSALAVACMDRSAAGQTAPDRVSLAVALFDDAKEMMDKGHFAEACPKLAESQALDPQVGTILNLALCYETVGKTASACATWKSAARAAALKDQTDRGEFALERAEGACGHVPRVTVQVAPQSMLDRVELKINEAPLPRDRWGLPEPLDPGQYEVSASGEGLQPWSSTFFVDEQHNAVVLVPQMAPVRLASPPEPPVRAGGRNSNGLRTAGWITSGLGLATLGVGAAFGVGAIVNKNESTGPDCVGNNCNATGQSDRARAIRDGHVADATLAVGAAALVGGAVLLLVWARASRAPSSVYLRPAIGQNEWSISVGEAWR